MSVIWSRISNSLLSICAGLASFAFTLIAFMLVQGIDEKIVASLGIGLFALLVVWVASERPNSGHARASAALIDRLLGVSAGDLTTPAPPVVRQEMPALASAVDALFEQVRSNLANVNAMALYDPVTSLPNRIQFKREGERLMSARAGGEKVALLFVDLDGFKEVDDNLGHAEGDHILEMVATRLRVEAKAETDFAGLPPPLVARLAGDEFTLLFPSVRGERQVQQIASRLLTALSQPYQGSQWVELGASIGVAVAPAHGEDLTSLMKAADIAMYHAKESGRAQVAVYDAALGAAFTERSETEKMLRNALAQDDLLLLYQPQLCARTEQIVAGEALLRWNHPNGLRLPSTFIGLAEESSLIVDIGNWVIDEVVEAMDRWRAAGMTQRLTFNVSPRQLDRHDFFEYLRHAFRRLGPPPWPLELEFTETVAMRCSDSDIQQLAALRKDGVTIAIDDFGSGYSNFARMKEMPLDRVKLDRTLVHDVDTSESGRTIVAAIIHLIHGLGLEVVAEGVERREQFDVLRTIGCDLVQGYAFAKPMAEERFCTWVRAGEAQPLSQTA